MKKLQRFSISLEQELLQKFDQLLQQKGYTNRSEAIRELLRGIFVQEEWKSTRDLIGAITMVYSHKQRELTQRLTAIQHQHHHNILSTVHFHLDHDQCLEILAIRGKRAEIEVLYYAVKAVKGVKHCALAQSTTGQFLP